MGGQDKGLVRLAGRPLVEHVLSGLEPQVGRVMISANRNAELYARYGWEIVPDLDDGFLGPLAGIAAGIRAAATDYVLAVPCDSPMLPGDLAARLFAACETDGSQLAIVDDGERTHPVFMLVHRDLLPEIEAYLEDGERKMMRWVWRQGASKVDFSDCPECFRNVNNEDELRALEDVVGGPPSAV